MSTRKPDPDATVARGSDATAPEGEATVARTGAPAAVEAATLARPPGADTTVARPGVRGGDATVARGPGVPPVRAGEATVARGVPPAGGEAGQATRPRAPLPRGEEATVARGGGMEPDPTATRGGATRLSQTLTAHVPGSAASTLVPDAAAPRARVPERAPARARRLDIGHRLRDRYLLDKLIGQGAMGQVWRAKDLLGEEARDRDPYVAVKVLTGDVGSHPEAFIALHREAARAQKLAHPNIITVYVFDRCDRSGCAFIAMELLQGQPLDRVIRDAAGGLPRKQALPIIRGMAEGLAYAHRRGLVHSDFKPANVFLTREGVPKILDFGIARAIKSLEPDAERSAAMDDSGFQGYTAAYAPPEVLAGSFDASTADDVFALGMVAYELLTGKHAFERRDALQAEAEGVRPAPLRGVSRREARAIERALAFQRAKRPRDGAAFLRELQGIPVIQKVLVAAVATLVLAAGGLWYARYLDTLPAQPLTDLPVDVQTKFRHLVEEGNDSLGYMERAHDIGASADAADYFAQAYKLHPKDPLAVAGLARAADSAIAWFMQKSGKSEADKSQAHEELKKFRDKSDYYKNYMPLVRAIGDTGGE